MTSSEYLFLSSSTVREIASLGGPTTGMVPELVERRLREKFAEQVDRRNALSIS
ncbi:phosphopantetheine adenylyltransferase [compost metagenome]